MMNPMMKKGMKIIYNATERNESQCTHRGFSMIHSIVLGYFACGAFDKDNHFEFFKTEKVREKTW